jgi:signal transduction histidine kinase
MRLMCSKLLPLIMESVPSNATDCSASAQPLNAPRASRRPFAAPGIQGKLIVSFTLLLMLALGFACRAFASETRSALLHAGVLVLAILPLICLLVHKFFHPVRELIDAANRIAAGDLSARISVHRTDLISTLARSFNAMADHVKLQHETLESRIRERTAQLEAANHRLQLESREKEDFLRAVSHDLTAPLRNISGMATMLLMKHRDKFSDDIVHRLERIQKNVAVETDLIGELLELSRIRTRRQKMELIDPATLVHELAGLFEDDLRKRSIHLTVEGSFPSLLFERPRLRQVFQNLIDNAIKYMGDGSQREIRVGFNRHDTGLCEFYVCDTGIGIDPEDLGKIFFVFRRGKNSAAQNVPGKGVGLASVKSILETYGGSIRVESQLRKGSSFYFTLDPQYLAPAEEPARSRWMQNFSSPTPASPQPLPQIAA